MASSGDWSAKPQRVTLVRGGEAGAAAPAGGPGAVRRVEPAAPAPPPAAAPGETPATFNGVPVSAARHCCGKGCRHCRIYWGLRKL